MRRYGAGRFGAALSLRPARRLGRRFVAALLLAPGSPLWAAVLPLAHGFPLRCGASACARADFTS